MGEQQGESSLQEGGREEGREHGLKKGGKEGFRGRRDSGEEGWTEGGREGRVCMVNVLIYYRLELSGSLVKSNRLTRYRFSSRLI